MLSSIEPAGTAALGNRPTEAEAPVAPTKSSFSLTKTPLVCHGHTRPIVDINYSQPTPDGIFLASASKDGQPQLRTVALAIG